MRRAIGLTYQQCLVKMWFAKRTKLKNDLTLIANGWLAAHSMEPWVLPSLWCYSAGDYVAYKINGLILGDRFLFSGPHYTSLRFISLEDWSKNTTITVKRSDTGLCRDDR
jgi:hypothetical protein